MMKTLRRLGHDIVHRVRHRRGFERRGERSDRRRMAETCAMVDVVRAHQLPHELLKEVVFLVAAFSGRQEADGVGSVRVADADQPLGDQIERTVPVDLYEIVPLTTQE